MGSLEEWPNYPDDYLESRKHDIHVHLQILKRDIEEIHEYLVHYQEPWISEGHLRKAIAKWKKEDAASWRTVEELENQSMIQSIKSPGSEPVMMQAIPTAVEDHQMQKTSRKKHIGLARTMSSSTNKNHQNQGSSILHSISLKKTLGQSPSDTGADFKPNASSNVIKAQFAKHDFANKTHYKLPDLLSPSLKRSNTSLSPKLSPAMGENGTLSQGHSRSNTKQVISANTTFAPIGIMSPGQPISDTIKTQFASMSTHYKEPDVLSPPTSRENSIKSRSPIISPRIEQNDKYGPYFSRSNASSPRNGPQFSLDQGNSESYQKAEYSSPVPKHSYSPNDRAILGLGRPNTTNDPSNNYDQNRANLAPGHSKTLAHKPSHGKGTIPIPIILPSADGRYRPDPNQSPQSQTNPNNFPIRSSSLARKAVGSNAQNTNTPANPSYWPPSLSKDDTNAIFRSQDSHAYPTGNLQSPDYGQYDAHDMRSQYSQSHYSQYPSQIRGNTDFENFGLDKYPLPPLPPVPPVSFDYKDTSSSNFTSSSVPIAMYPNTPNTSDATTTSNFVKPFPSANHPQILANYNQRQPDDFQLQYDQFQSQNQNLEQNDRRGPQRNSSSSATASQRAARRATVWDGANEFSDPGAMPIIEENPGEWEKVRQREDRLAQEKSFDFSSFLSDLTRV